MHMSKRLEIKLRLRNVGAEYSFHYSPVNRFEPYLLSLSAAQIKRFLFPFFYSSYFYNNERLVFHIII